MLVEGLIYCLQSRLKLRRAEGSINAGGCNFNSFLRRTVRFVGTGPVQHRKLRLRRPRHLQALTFLFTHVPLQVCTCSVCVRRLWSLTLSSCRQVTTPHFSSPSVNQTTLRWECRVTKIHTSLKTSAPDTTNTPSWLPGRPRTIYLTVSLSL